MAVFLRIMGLSPYICVFMAPIALASYNQPLVYWSMDTTTKTKLLPDLGNETRYTVALPVDRKKTYFSPGVVGNGLTLKQSKIKLIKDIDRTDCLRNPIMCKDGLTITFWINLKKRTRDERQIILMSCNSVKRRPGIYIGGSNSVPNEMKFLVRTAEGKQYTKKLTWSIIEDKWTHFAMVWNITMGIEVFLNGSKIEEEQDIQDVPAEFASKNHLYAGDNFGPIFSLDDLWIFYQALPNTKIFNCYELGLPMPKMPPADTTDSKPSIEDPLPEQTTAGSKSEEFVYALEQNVTLSSETVVPWDEKSEYNTSDLAIEAIPKTTFPREKSHRASPTVWIDIFVNVTSERRNSSTPLSTIKTNITRLSSVTTSQTPSKLPIPTPNSPPHTPYVGWFYNQSWYYTAVVLSIFAMVAVSVYVYVIHCCVGTRNGPAEANVKSDEVVSAQPLIAQT